MNVAGYREALAAAQPVEVSRGFVVPVVSLPALAILKVLAWDDRGAEDSKDALDLAALLRRYHEAGNEDRLFGEEFGLFEASDHNIDRAGPHLLGKDAARIITAATREQVVSLLADAARQGKLVKDMAKGFWGTDDPIAEAEATISRFRMGLEGG
jgi:predicted nucleotidyltransferase